MDGDLPLGEAHSKATLAEQRLKERFGDNTHIIIHMEPSHHGTGTDRA